ncbi:hypothetical protein HDU83_007643 [Entophlyctis luteolus]|nr:hypothetical protein HDU83_007643 [Entophlyctis luteolus]KAJ3378020.1 hypothetical protein HDU84_008023 [Entophlyctis sp. JEL0112]
MLAPRETDAGVTPAMLRAPRAACSLVVSLGGFEFISLSQQLMSSTVAAAVAIARSRSHSPALVAYPVRVTSASSVQRRGLSVAPTLRASVAPSESSNAILRFLGAVAPQPPLAPPLPPAGAASTSRADAESSAAASNPHFPSVADKLGRSRTTGKDASGRAKSQKSSGRG